MIFRKLFAAALVIGVPAAVYGGFKSLSGVVSVPVLIGVSAVFVFVCWKIANWFDAREAARSVDNFEPPAVERERR